MNLRTKISEITLQWFGREDGEKIRKERFVESIINTHAFSKLSLQDKMLSLGKLITLFRSENGYTPKSLERTLESLNHEMNRKMLDNWNALYSGDHAATVA